MDVVITVPKGLWTRWLDEGDCPGDPPTGEEWGYRTWGPKPDIEVGERVYVVAHGRLRGYSPLSRLEYDHRQNGQGYVAFGRKAGAVAVTIPRPIRGFRGWRYVDWKREEEIPFPAWKTEGVEPRPVHESSLSTGAEE